MKQQRRLSRAERRLRLAECVRQAIAERRLLEGRYTRPNRIEWAGSRKAAGWSEHLVDQAVAAGSLRRVRSAIEDPPKDLTKKLREAMTALGLIDAGLHLEYRSSRLSLNRMPRSGTV